jgi:hypothetical protein
MVIFKLGNDNLSTQNRVVYILWHDDWQPEYFIARHRIDKHIPAEANARNNRKAVFSMVRAALVATQRCSKHISAAVNQDATTEEAVISVGAAPRISGS